MEISEFYNFTDTFLQHFSQGAVQLFLSSNFQKFNSYEVVVIKKEYAN